MLKITIADTKYNIPTSFKDVAVSDFINFMNVDEGIELQSLSVRTGIAIEVLKQLNLDDLKHLSDLTAFYYDAELLNTYNVVDERISKAVDVAQLSFEKIQQAKDILEINKDRNIFNAGPELVRVYLNEDIGDKPITEWYGIMNFFLSRFKTSLRV